MKHVFLILCVMLLAGCFDDTSDLTAYMADVKKHTNSYIAPMPKVPPFNHFQYSAKSLRSPFVAPKPEAIKEKMQQMAGCMSPDPRRRKQPLEKYALGDLTMRGTLGEAGTLWALIEASDKTLHRVSVGQYLGLYNGRITQVSQNNIKVVELIPDGKGCWSERETVIAMTDANKEVQGK